MGEQPAQSCARPGDVLSGRCLAATQRVSDALIGLILRISHQNRDGLFARQLRDCLADLSLPFGPGEPFLCGKGRIFWIIRCETNFPPAAPAPELVVGGIRAHSQDQCVWVRMASRRRLAIW